MATWQLTGATMALGWERQGTEMLLLGAWRPLPGKLWALLFFFLLGLHRCFGAMPANAQGLLPPGSVLTQERELTTLRGIQGTPLTEPESAMCKAMPLCVPIAMGTCTVPRKAPWAYLSAVV